MSPTRFFLSYARGDGRQICEQFHDLLTNMKHEPFRDESDIPGGDEWEEAIANAIARADVMLVFWTRDAPESVWVRYEYDRALALGKRVVPLLIADVPLPEKLQGRQYHTLSPGETANVLSKLIGEIEAHWSKLQGDLATALAAFEKGPSELRRALTEAGRDLDVVLRARPRPYPIEVCTAVLSIFTDLHAEVRRGKDAQSAIAALREGRISGVQTDLWVQHRNTFDNHLSQVEDLLSGDSISVPIVFFVMNRVEAEALASGEAFQGFPDELNAVYNEVCAELPDGWIERYHDTPQGMIAFGGQDDLAGLITGALKDVECSKRLRPNFLDPRGLNRERLIELREKGCLVVVDAVSTYHPHLQRCFRNSFLDSSPKTLVARIEIGMCRGELNHQNALVDAWFLTEYRFRVAEEKDRCRKASQPQDFKDWLRYRMSLLVPDDCKVGAMWSLLNAGIGR